MLRASIAWGCELRQVPFSSSNSLLFQKGLDSWVGLIPCSGNSPYIIFQITAHWFQFCQYVDVLAWLPNVGTRRASGECHSPAKHARFGTEWQWFAGFWHGVPFLSVKCRFKHLWDVFLVPSLVMFSSKLDWWLACLMAFFWASSDISLSWWLGRGILQLNWNLNFKRSFFSWK